VIRGVPRKKAGEVYRKGEYGSEEAAITMHTKKEGGGSKRKITPAKKGISQLPGIGIFTRDKRARDLCRLLTERKKWGGTWIT